MLENKIKPSFKLELKKFLSEAFHTCIPFIKDIDKCETYEELKKCFERNADDISESVGHECEYDEDDINGLKSTIQNLEIEVGELEEIVIDTPTFWDEERLEIYKELGHNFTPVEFELILRNALNNK